MSRCSWLQKERRARQVSPMAAAESCSLADRALGDLERQLGEGKAAPCAGIFSYRPGEKLKSKQPFDPGGMAVLPLALKEGFEEGREGKYIAGRLGVCACLLLWAFASRHCSGSCLVCPGAIYCGEGRAVCARVVTQNHTQLGA